MIPVFARNHNNVIAMESPQEKPIRLNDQKGRAIRINMGIDELWVLAKKNYHLFSTCFQVAFKLYIFLLTPKFLNLP
jgi:hypothetical protein